jgi:hypothetical protein
VGINPRAGEISPEASSVGIIPFRVRIADLLDAAEKELVGEPLVLLVFRAVDLRFELVACELFGDPAFRST